MLSLSHPHPSTAAPRRRRALPPVTPAPRRRRFTYTKTTAVLLGPDGNPIGNWGQGRAPNPIGGGLRDRNNLPFTPPPSAPLGQLHQPFHPPQPPLPENFRNLDLTQRLAVLRDRLGQWHEYAPLVSSLSREGFTPSSIEEATGITGVEQNCLIVASQVRDSLLADGFPDDLIAYFDSYGGPELLYELRFLNAVQRADAARYAIASRLEPKGVRELARSMKDIPRRRGDEGFESFTGASPGDCLAFARFRQSLEAIVVEDRISELQRALQVVETDKARARVELEMEKARKKAAGEEVEDDVPDVAARPDVPVVRLAYGEVADASTVLLLPVVRETDGVEAFNLAPRRSKADVDLGIVEVDKGWTRWAVLPGWGPVAAVAAEAVVIELADGRALPWRSAEEEKVLVVANRASREVAEEGIYVVDKEGKLVVESGRKLWAQGVAEAAAEVLIVVRPPKDDADNFIDDDEWD